MAKQIGRNMSPQEKILELANKVFKIAPNKRTEEYNGKQYTNYLFDIRLLRKIMSGEIDGLCATKAGTIVRIICTDAKGDFPIVGLIDYGNNERPKRFRMPGTHRDDYPTDFDLELWIEVHNEVRYV